MGPTFLASYGGRAARIVAGAALVVAGTFLCSGWWVLVVVGLVPVAMGLRAVCGVNVLGRRLRGMALRSR